jgi:dihydrolipoamide dehydrogenase
MEQRNVDVAIIGAGTAGLGARRGALAEGASVLMADPGPLGTTCARVGCMPSKLLIAASERAHHARHSALFGVDATVSVDGKRVLERVQRERDRFVGFVLDSCNQAREAGELIDGRAKFVGPHQLQIETANDPLLVEAKSIVIASGTTPFVPPPFRGLGDRLLSNEHIFELSDLPKSVLVVGAGVIALELGQALHRLGTRVSLVNIDDSMGPLRDPDVLEVTRQIFSQELELFLSYQLESIELGGEGVKIALKDSSGQHHEREFEYVLCAAGRKPTFNELDIAKAELPLDARGMPTFDSTTMQIGDSHVFVAGDANGERPVLHEAADEGRIAGRNAALFPNVEAGHRSTMLGVVFTDPQLAIVGQTYGELAGRDYLVGEIDYSDQGRSRVMDVNKGLVHIYADKQSGELLGAEMAGPSVEHTAHLLAWAVQQKMTVTRALEMPFYHPVVEEGIRTALRDLRDKLAAG